VDVVTEAGVDALTALRTIWLQRRDEVLARVDQIEAAVAAALEGTLDDDLRRDAAAQAHMLAGSSGTFGFAEASDHARRLELALNGAAPPAAQELPGLADHVVALRRELEREDAIGAGPGTSTPERVDLLVIGGRPGRGQRLADEATVRGLRCLATGSIEGALGAVERHDPALVLLDLDVPEGPDAALRFLEQAVDRRPVLVIVDPGQAVDRVEVARRGGRGFLPSTLDVTQTMEETLGARDRMRRHGTRVLVVDDDPAVLDLVRSVLMSADLEVHLSDGADDYWEALQRTDPDIVVLDIELPAGRSGIDLCRAMRNDRRWAALPAVVLSARTDRETITEVFAAGADDYVPKPFVGPELLARIANRLERVRLMHELADQDHLTGLATRRRGAELLEGLRAVAERTGEPFCLAVLDCDDFKRINDVYGHAMGDMVLRALGIALQRAFGAEDAVVRWGGDEFVVGMYGMTVEDARERLGQLLEDVAGRRFASHGKETEVRLSCGLAMHPDDGDTVEALVRAADDGLYRAKSEGGGRVTLAESARSDSVNVDVVVVEDDPALGALLQHALTARGYSFRYLDDGLEAAAALAGSRPEVVGRVILLDWDLPGIDGLRILRMMAENGTLAHSRVIMVTSRAGESEVREARAAGAVDHVAKPFSVPVLMQRVRHAMAP
jgi:diguanylate cyclase (GGDEF)-like protein